MPIITAEFPFSKMVGEGPYPPYFILIGDQPQPGKIFPPDFNMETYQFVCFMNAVMLNDVNVVNKLFEFWKKGFINTSARFSRIRKYRLYESIHFRTLDIELTSCISILSREMITCLHYHGMITIHIIDLAFSRPYYRDCLKFWNNIIHCIQLLNNDEIRSKVPYAPEHTIMDTFCEYYERYSIEDSEWNSGADRFRAILEIAGVERTYR